MIPQRSYADAFEAFMDGLCDDLPPILIHQAVLFEPKMPDEPKQAYTVEEPAGRQDCAGCGRPKTLREGELPSQMRARKYCSVSCYDAAMRGRKLRQDKIDAIQAMARTSQYTIHEIALALDVSISTARKYCNIIGYWGMKDDKPVWRNV